MQRPQVHSNLSKALLYVPSGDLTHAPADLATVRSFQVAGTFVGDTASCRADALALITARLAPLDHVMRLEDCEHVTNSLQLKFDLIRMCAAMIYGHWAGSMPPEQTDLGAAYSDCVVSAATAALVASADSPVGRPDLALACAAALPNPPPTAASESPWTTLQPAHPLCRVLRTVLVRVPPRQPEPRRHMPIQGALANAAPASPTIASFCASYDRITAAAADLHQRQTALASQRIHWVDGSTHQPYFPRTAPTRPGSLPASANLRRRHQHTSFALLTARADGCRQRLRVARPPPRCTGFDSVNDAAVVPHGEATRLISCSQEGSGAFIARLPDVTLQGSIIASSAFLVILQRHLGLYLTALKATLVH